MASHLNTFTISFADKTPAEWYSFSKAHLSHCNEEWERKIWSFVKDWNDNTVSHITVHTSGSTGTPKTITHNKKWILQSALNTINALELKCDYVALLCLPADKIGGMMMLVRAMALGMKLICIKPTSDPFKDIEQDIKVNFAAFTPMQLVHALETNEGLNRVESIEKIIIGGSDLPIKLLETIKTLKNDVFATYGMTETISHIALRRLTSPAETYYTALPGVTLQIDHRGCLVITAPAIGVKDLVTNDVVNLITPVQFEWKGRWDNVINTGGLKISAEAFEKEWQKEITIPFFVSGIPNELTGEQVVLVMEASTLSVVELEKIKSLIMHKSPKNTRPRLLLLANPFVYNNGKLLRKETLNRVHQKIVL